MFYQTEFEKVYLINGLSRSGNHLFIAWLISSFQDHEVYYLNNVYPKKHIGLYNSKKINIEHLLKQSVATCDGNDEGLSFDNEIILNKLVYKNDMIKLLEGKVKKAKILIISIENNFVDILDIVGKKFINAKKIYKIIIMRDLFNLMASRFEAESKIIQNITKNIKDFKWHQYNTDIITFGYWINNYINMFNKNYISYNYNKFVLDIEHRKELSKLLDIDYDKTLITHPKFLRGSSFKNNNNTDVYKYFMRWYSYKDHPLIHFFMNNQELKDVMCNDFYFCLEDHNIKIKDYHIDINEYTKKIESKTKKNKSKTKSKSKRESKVESKTKSKK